MITIPRCSCIIPLMIISCATPVSAQDDVNADTAQVELNPAYIPATVIQARRSVRPNVELISTNNGITGNEYGQSRVGGFWPRGSGKGYIFSSGIWFGTRRVTGGVDRKLSAMACNVRVGKSRFVPGRAFESIPASWPQDTTPAGMALHRVYNSNDYDLVTGAPLDTNDPNGPAWPVWSTGGDNVVGNAGYFGDLVADPADRSRTRYPGGPAFVSDEDVITTYKDTDPSVYYGFAVDSSTSVGYPIGLQVEQSTYGWASGLLADVTLFRYALINISGTTLRDCYAAFVIDYEIGNGTNDLGSLAIEKREDDSLDLALCYSQREATAYAYLGVDLLETPAIDTGTGNVISGHRILPEQSQLGLVTNQFWGLAQDPVGYETRYNFMAAGDRDSRLGVGDQRLLMASGPFNMKPGDTTHLAVALIFAYPRDTTVAPTGQFSDLQDLLILDSVVQRYYYRGVGTGEASVTSPSGSTAPISLVSLHPQPFNASGTSIDIAIARNADISYDLFDLLGRLVQHTDIGPGAIGTRTIHVDGSRLAPGNYQCIIHLGHAVLPVSLMRAP